MRYLIYGIALLLLFATIPTPSLAGALASAAGALFEATPYIIGGALLARLIGRDWLVAYLGCGCGHGPSGRSLPAALATYFVFGPVVAVLRLIAATFVACATHSHATRNCAHRHPHARSSIVDELATLVPSMLLAGLVLQLAPLAALQHTGIAVQLAVGAALGFVAAPCALGAVAIASALHTQAPTSCVAFLCVAGIADLRTWNTLSQRIGRGHDALANAILAVALAIVAYRAGDALVHPALAPFLGISSIVVLIWFIRERSARNPSARVAPAIMLAGALITAPAPTYTATETTLGNAFPNEPLRFTGVVVRDGATTALVRYAITCCRADATPVVVRLVGNVMYPARTWLAVDGKLVRSHNELRLAAQRIKAIAPPADPFVYR